jgi:hypothetical protein
MTFGGVLVFRGASVGAEVLGETRVGVSETVGTEEATRVGASVGARVDGRGARGESVGGASVDFLCFSNFSSFSSFSNLPKPSRSASKGSASGVGVGSSVGVSLDVAGESSSASIRAFSLLSVVVEPSPGRCCLDEAGSAERGVVGTDPAVGCAVGALVLSPIISANKAASSSGLLVSSPSDPRHDVIPEHVIKGDGDDESEQNANGADHEHITLKKHKSQSSMVRTTAYGHGQEQT